jgi:7,8-dihydropterin-6-yl-methyl-4-(beta-D-ribofuranosyl)aminobenzene 5'-phosphate synthase
MKRFPNAQRAFLLFSFLLAGGLLQAQTQANPSRTVRILYDNRASTPGTKARHGFSCLIEGTGKAILFDTGADKKTLVYNMKALDIDNEGIGAIVISHLHNDHTGGLAGVFRADSPVPVFIPRQWTFGTAGAALKAASAVSKGFSPLEGFDGTYLTGPLGRSTIEQGLVLDTPSGIVLITGCAHPGVVEMVEATKKALGRDVCAVLGGFHLSEKNEDQVRAIIFRLKALGVQKCGAGHCTGDKAIALFREAFGDAFIELGTGAVIEFD